MSIFTEQRAPKLITTLRRYFPSVDRVADGTEAIKITVLKRDLTKALKKKHQACVMARACERQIPKCDGALIQRSRAYIIKGDLAVRYIVPHSVGREITSFDRHKDFRLGEYHLAAMSKSQTLGKVRNRDKHRKRGADHDKIKKRLVLHRTDGIRGFLAHDGV